MLFAGAAGAPAAGAPAAAAVTSCCCFCCCCYVLLLLLLLLRPADVAAGVRCRPLHRSATSGEGEDDEEDEDFDLPKDLGIRTWTKSLSKEERAKRMTSSKAKTAILSVQ